MYNYLFMSVCVSPTFLKNYSNHRYTVHGRLVLFKGLAVVVGGIVFLVSATHLANVNMELPEALNV